MKKVLLGLAAVGLLGVGYIVTAAKADLLEIKVQPPVTGMPTEEVAVSAVLDNQDGTTTVIIDACGSTVTVLIANELIAKEDANAQTRIQNAIRRACSGLRANSK